MKYLWAHICANWFQLRNIHRGARVAEWCGCAVFVTWETPSHYCYRIFYGTHDIVHVAMDVMNWRNWR
jgi:hypothetical protein